MQAGRVPRAVESASTGSVGLRRHRWLSWGVANRNAAMEHGKNALVGRRSHRWECCASLPAPRCSATATEARSRDTATIVNPAHGGISVAAHPRLD